MCGHVPLEEQQHGSVPTKEMYTEREFHLWQRWVDDRVTVCAAFGMAAIVLTYISGFVLRAVVRTLYRPLRACTT